MECVLRNVILFMDAQGCDSAKCPHRFAVQALGDDGGLFTVCVELVWLESGIDAVF